MNCTQLVKDDTMCAGSHGSLRWQLPHELWQLQAKGNGSWRRCGCWQVDVTANALLLYHDPGSLRTWLGLTANVAHYLRYSGYTRLRPQVILFASQCIAASCRQLQPRGCMSTTQACCQHMQVSHCRACP